MLYRPVKRENFSARRTDYTYRRQFDWYALTAARDSHADNRSIDRDNKSICSILKSISLSANWFLVNKFRRSDLASARVFLSLFPPVGGAVSRKVPSASELMRRNDIFAEGKSGRKRPKAFRNALLDGTRVAERNPTFSHAEWHNLHSSRALDLP